MDVQMDKRHSGKKDSGGYKATRIYIYSTCPIIAWGWGLKTNGSLKISGKTDIQRKKG
jgi:hypothetical protein